MSNKVSAKTGEHPEEVSWPQVLQGHLTVDHSLLLSPSPDSIAHEQDSPTAVASNTSEQKEAFPM